MSADLIARKDHALRRGRAALVTMKRYRGTDDARADAAAMRVHGACMLVIVLNTREHQTTGAITPPRMYR